MERKMVAGLLLSLLLAILVLAYLLLEPGRIQAAAEQIRERAVTHGRDLFRANCTACHGPEGEGTPGLAPPLNAQGFLEVAGDRVIHDLIANGKAGTAMPAWAEDNGGPLREVDIAALVAFIRSWQPTAPEIPSQTTGGSPARGSRLYAATCVVCHGPNGEGNIGPALNSPQFLESRNDQYIRSVITEGVLSKGMPTWGVVLTADQITDLVAFIRGWQAAATPALPAKPLIDVAAVFAANCQVCHGANGQGGFGPALARPELLDTLTDAAITATITDGRPGTPMRSWQDALSAEEIAALVELLRGWQRAAAARTDTAAALSSAAAIFAARCAACHGPGGSGGFATDLRRPEYLAATTAEELAAVIATGRPGTAMPAWQGRLSPEEIAALVAYLRGGE
ncbi:MAG: c-type cytochrome [Deinococcus sp.]|nr:c-type cytochrome [Deinococcus sp.]